MADKNAKKRFKEADELYRAGRYFEAIKLLELLNEEWPEERNILFPLAFSYAATGNLDKARALLDTLNLKFDDRRSEKLDRYIERRRIEMEESEASSSAASPPPASPPMTSTGTHLSDPLAAFSVPSKDAKGAAPVLPAPPAAEPSRSRVADPLGLDAPVTAGPRLANPDDEDDTLMWKILLVVATLFFIFVDISINRASMDPNGQNAILFGEGYIQTMEAIVPWSSFIVVPLRMVVMPFPLYFLLFYMERLPYNNFWKNYFCFYGYHLLIALTSLLCCVGAIIGYSKVNKRFDLGFGGVFCLIMFQIFAALVQFGFELAFYFVLGVLFG